MNIIEKILIDYNKNSIGQNSQWFINYSINRKESFLSSLNQLLSYLPPPPASILDVGSAPFVLPEALARLGYEVSALDLAPERFENLDKLSCTVVKGNAELPNTIVLNERFDVILLSHVFEHFHLDILASLEGIKSLLKPSGLLVLDTPNLLSIIGWRNLILRRTAYSCANSVYHELSKLKRIGHMGHIREYTQVELKELLEGCGFAIEKIEHQDYLVGGGWKRNILRFLQLVFPGLKMNIHIQARRLDI